MIALLVEGIILLVIVLIGYFVVFASYQKTKGVEPASVEESKPHLVNHEMTALGYIDGGKTFVIPEEDRQNIGVFGEIGSGKTSVLRLLIMQDIMRGTGFLLVDPHREFSREVLSLIPAEQQDRVVYISLASLYQFGRTVCINPLQAETEHEKYIRTAGVIDNLKQYFSDGWGHRLETILRNMINLVMSTPETFKFLDIISVLFDESKRNGILQRCPLPTVRNFWTKVFPKFAPEAAGAIYNKFDKIINTPPIAAMFSSAESTISFKEVIEEGKIVIVDLGSAATLDIIEFMGTMLINMFNLENKIRFDLGDSAKTPFNIYIDEVHMFSAPVIRELLNNVRKYNMKVTVATQSIKVLDDKLAKELDDLFRCMVMFRCDHSTAKLLARNMPLDEKELAHMGFHRFAAFSQGSKRVSGVGKTRHIEIPSRWEGVARNSLERYGKEIHTDLYTKKDSTLPKISPLEYFLLNMLYLGNREISHDELVSSGIAKFGLDVRAVNSALVDSLYGHHKYVERSTNYREGKNQYDTNVTYSISKLGVQSIYSRVYAGHGAGSLLHTGVISAIADRQIEQYHYCIPDLADTTGRRADLLVYEFQLVHGKVNNGEINPLMWSERVMAVEVETDPTKHRGQIIINYEKNIGGAMRVCFVVFSEKHKVYVINALAEDGVGAELYDIITVDPKSIDTGCDESVSGSYSNLSASQVMARLESMGVSEESSVLKGMSQQTIDSPRVKKTRRKKDTITASLLTLKASLDADTAVTVGYTRSEIAALKILLNDKSFEEYDVLRAELRKRGFGVRRMKSGSVTIYTFG